MKISEFTRKLAGAYLWGNLLAMAAAVFVLSMAVKWGLDVYTHHGEAIVVPNLKHKQWHDVERILNDAGLQVQVSDTGYVKNLPAGCVLEQSIDAGQTVKSGRVIYVVINAEKTPTLPLPDIIDNSSLREAMARLTAMGFKLAQPQFVPGEKDWVYGVTVKGKHKVAGDRIMIDDPVVILVGNGMIDEDDHVNFVDPQSDTFDDTGNNETVDEFEEVTAPPQNGSNHNENNETAQP